MEISEELLAEVAPIVEEMIRGAESCRSLDKGVDIFLGAPTEGAMILAELTAHLRGRCEFGDNRLYLVMKES